MGKKQPYYSKETVSAEDSLKALELQYEAMRLPPIDIDDPKQIWARFCWYVEQCRADALPVGVASACNAIGITRTTLLKWARGEARAADTRYQQMAERILQMVEAFDETQVKSGKVNPITTIFLMRNNHGYHNDDEIIRESNADRSVLTSAEDLKRRYLAAGDDTRPDAEIKKETPHTQAVYEVPPDLVKDKS